jgi:hypothetical protein
MTARIAASAIGAACSEAARAAADQAEQQLELLAPTRFAANDSRAATVREGVARQRAGRPEGARNLVTRDVLAFVRRVFGDPMIESARLLLHSPDSLALEFRCTPFEAAKFQEEIRRDLRRFMYAPLAAVDDEGKPVPQLTMIVGGQQIVLASGQTPWGAREALAGVPPRAIATLDARAEPVKEIQQNQAVADPVDGQSHALRSHDDEKP